MNTKFPEYKNFNLSKINKTILKEWNRNDTFKKSLEIRKNHPSFVFYEGPPSANGMPGIHHVMARTLKDIVCRYKTLKGFRVDRKAGWDTHGLPVELGVEKELGITKEDIGTKISVEEYNQACKTNVMKYTREWEDLTAKMGYWVNMDDPYITYDNRYIESLWYLLKKMFEKGLLYKGYSIQPFSPAAGTALSTHELNQPGCYRDVTDTTVVGMFKLVKNEQSEFLHQENNCNTYFLAWTTTPWTLPSNTALAVGKEISYLQIKTFNPYTGTPCVVILAKDLCSQFFDQKNETTEFGEYQSGSKVLPYQILSEYKGKQLEGIAYEQLMPLVKPEGEAFRVILGDFVTTEDGTGIVHIAPTFGADDDRVAKNSGISPLILRDKYGKSHPMVDRSGKFFLIEDLDPEFVKKQVNTKAYREYAGRFVKNDFDPKLTDQDPGLDIDIAVNLKKNNLAFKVAKHVHNYPHCWRTDKPVLYYPLDSWFIKSTKMKNRMIELNKTINWKPQSTGEGRFGKWLENLQDWNLSRSRYWGTPLPIWISEDATEIKCIGSVQELKTEIEKAIQAGFMTENLLAAYTEGDNSKENYEKFDLHRPYVDEIFLVSDSGKKMARELDLIDVWFDSGAMPYAQQHYPFENKDGFEQQFPAQFIAEGVDQTRGWFFTLHAIATMVFDSVAFENIISNGLVLDAKGNKMSKRHGNAIDPFETIEKYGSDPLRWYMITNAQAWDNLKFDLEGIEEVHRKFFATLYNTYSFFRLYANIDEFTYRKADLKIEERPEIDRWILSLLNSLIQEVEASYEAYELTRAGRAIQEFVTENLSNWYVRLSRKRYWGGKHSKDKLSAYQTLYQCLETVAILASPIAPFYMDQLFLDLNSVTRRYKEESVHLINFQKSDASIINKELEERMAMAQKISSMALGLRRKVKIRVRQPLQKIMIPVSNERMIDQLQAVREIILSEINVKEMELISDTSGILVKKIKPNFKILGPKYGKMMKQLANAISQMSQEEILALEKNGNHAIQADNKDFKIGLDDVEIVSEDIPGCLVANEGKFTVALDVNITEKLKFEGIARELINRIQNLRKESDFDLTDKIKIEILKHDAINDAVVTHKEYIGSQTLAVEIQMSDYINKNEAFLVEIEAGVESLIKIEKV